MAAMDYRDETNAPGHSGAERSLVGNSPAFTRMMAAIDQVAATSTTVLLLGEAGTRKQLVARTIHERSSRRDRLFVELHCGASTFEMLKELFGVPASVSECRPGAVELLARYFVETFATKSHRRVPSFSDEAMQALVAHPWPENDQELEHVAELAVRLSSPGETIVLEHLPGIR